MSHYHNLIDYSQFKAGTKEIVCTRADYDSCNSEKAPEVAATVEDVLFNAGFVDPLMEAAVEAELDAGAQSTEAPAAIEEPPPATPNKNKGKKRQVGERSPAAAVVGPAPKASTSAPLVSPSAVRANDALFGTSEASIEAAGTLAIAETDEELCDY